MALVLKSVDEVTEELADAFDELIQPQKIWRNNNNKAYLMLRAYAAGHVGLINTVLSLKYKFDPAYCGEDDLLSTAKIVGTELKQGTGSMLKINATNQADTSLELMEGIYCYRSVSGDVFSFELKEDYQFDANETKMYIAISNEKGSFYVNNNNNIKPYRQDGADIDSMFKFSCLDNINMLGYLDEDLNSFRTRLLNDSNRQDSLKELELKIRNLPSIFECDIIINEDTSTLLYDGISLQPKELLITITGVPTDEIAELVCQNTVYDTHQCDPSDVLYYYSNLYVNGKKPVYFRNHKTADFKVKITYQYDSAKLKTSQVEAVISKLFAPYREMVTRLDSFGEKDAYRILSEVKLPSVEILNADIIDNTGITVPFVNIPKTRLPNLDEIIYISVDITGI